MRIRNRVWSGKMRDESLSSCKNPCELRSQEEEEEEEEEEGKSNDNGDGDGDRDGAQFLMPLVVAALDAQSHLQEDEQHGELIKNSSSSSCARAAVNPKRSWRDLLPRSSSQVNRESSRGGTIIGKKRTANHREGMAAITETEAKGEEGEDNGEYSKASSDPKKNKEGIKAAEAAAADEDDYFNSSAAAKLRADQWRRREVRRQKQKKNGECEAENEATRCKRRNGKGWRCSATRVDGYSLCQHHLNGTPAWKRLRNLKAETAAEAEAEAEAAPASASAPTTTTTTNVNVNVNVTVTVTGTGTVKPQPQTKKHKKQQQQTNETTTTVVNEDKMNKKKKKKERSLKDINTVLDHYHQ